MVRFQFCMIVLQGQAERALADLPGLRRHRQQPTERGEVDARARRIRVLHRGQLAGRRKHRTRIEPGAPQQLSGALVTSPGGAGRASDRGVSGGPVSGPVGGLVGGQGQQQVLGRDVRALPGLRVLVGVGEHLASP